MEGRGEVMKKIRLSPLVFKVKGAKNYAFFDLLNRVLFQAAPGGNIEELKDFLLEKELVCNTERVVPFKFQVDVSDFKEKIIIRELQIRVTGRCNENCPECGQPCRCFKGDGDISGDTLKTLFQQLENLPVHEVVVTGGNPLIITDALDVLNMIRREVPAKKFKVLSMAVVETGEANRLREMGFEIVTSHKLVSEITEDQMKIDAFTFFYQQEFNPCWGNLVAVDVDGTIKPCLWADDVLGNIHENNIGELVISGAFDEYWELTKDKIDTCNLCEYRYGCFDCRVSARKEMGSLTAKTAGCNYNPQ